MVKLGGQVYFSDYIIPACLPPPNEIVMIGLNCTITGWGDSEGTLTFRSYSTCIVLCSIKFRFAAESFPNEANHEIACLEHCYD